MRTLTIKSGGNNNSYNEGWHELTVSSAEYKEWNGTKCLDVNFEDYPEFFNMRIYEKIGTDGEEFAIGQVYRFANAGISSSLEGSDGTKIVKLDDSAEALMGKKMNVYFYKDGKYSRPLAKIAPTEFTNAVETFSAADVDYWKGKAIDFYQKFIKPKIAEKEANAAPVVEASTETEVEMPF